jgi:hypothetical protein
MIALQTRDMSTKIAKKQQFLFQNKNRKAQPKKKQEPADFSSVFSSVVASFFLVFPGVTLFRSKAKEYFQNFSYDCIIFDQELL